MDLLDIAVNSLRLQIAQTEVFLKHLKGQLATVEKEQLRTLSNTLADHSHAGPQTAKLRKTQSQLGSSSQANGSVRPPAVSLVTPPSSQSQPKPPPSQANGTSKWPLQPLEYKSYGRQLILPQIGLQGQLRLKKASVLIVGAGGLGCPAGTYLAGAGVGTIGFADSDDVEQSNLHRQILHTTKMVGQPKVYSAIEELSKHHSLPRYRAHREQITPLSALDTLAEYDIILDCTDRPASRYLISDAAVLVNKPLVSASALGLDGQLLVLNDGTVIKGAQPRKFCYRCVFPKPPPAETVLSCSEGGILGPVVGVMGVLMAIEAIKLIVRDTYHQKSGDSAVCPNPGQAFEAPPEEPSMLLFSANSDPMFRKVRIKGKRSTCPSCGCNPTITQEALNSGRLDYAYFCGLKDPMDSLPSDQRYTPGNFVRNRRTVAPDSVLVDVRPRHEFELGHIEDSINVPIQELANGHHGEELHTALRQLKNKRKRDAEKYAEATNPYPKAGQFVFTICRQGNDSQKAAKILQSKFYGLKVCDVEGGLSAWRKDIDPTFPDY
ncbi:MAG: hypothetical protein Q9218_006401 [Villophora microphyllina]